jgi:hypothetical protein
MLPFPAQNATKIEIIPSRTVPAEKTITRIVPLADVEAFSRDELDREMNIKILIDLNTPRTINGSAAPGPAA